jgi:hypothetical protein
VERERHTQPAAAGALAPCTDKRERHARSAGRKLKFYLSLVRFPIRARMQLMNGVRQRGNKMQHGATQR